MTDFYDDNFGHWHDTDDVETRKFYHQTQKQSVWKICSMCGKRVKIKKEYDKCNSCCEKLENGTAY